MDLPSLGTFEPAFDEPTEDHRSVAPSEDEDRDLDFSIGLDVSGGGSLIEGDPDYFAPYVEGRSYVGRPRHGVWGVPANDHFLEPSKEYDGWMCDCKASSKNGIPPRHFRTPMPPGAINDYGTDWRIMVEPGKGETKQAAGETQVASAKTRWVECPSWWPTETMKGWACSCGPDVPGHVWSSKRLSVSVPGRVGAPMYPDPTQVFEDATAARVATLAAAVECPSWRPARRTIARRERDWTKGRHGIKPPTEKAPPPEPPEHPAGPTEKPSYLNVADLPPRCLAKAFLVRPDVESRLKVKGRRVDDGPIVERFRIAGLTHERKWVAYWTEGKFDEARIEGRLVNLTGLRAFLKGNGDE